jgi:hypothetical protein
MEGKTCAEILGGILWAGQWRVEARTEGSGGKGEEKVWRVGRRKVRPVVREGKKGRLARGKRNYYRNY